MVHCVPAAVVDRSSGDGVAAAAVDGRRSHAHCHTTKPNLLSVFFFFFFLSIVGVFQYSFLYKRICECLCVCVVYVLPTTKAEAALTNHQNASKYQMGGEGDTEATTKVKLCITTITH